MPDPVINRGVILGQRSTDYIVGASSPIEYEVRNESGDWTPYLPSTEKQWFDGGDSMACVSFSAHNCIEAQIKFLTGKEVNLSDRWLAKMSGTTSQGNWLYVVADALRKYGAVNEEEWPNPPIFTWDSYYSDIPKHIVDKGLKFLNEWEVAYEWVTTDRESLMKHLKHAPLQLVIPGHAVMGFYSEADVTKYFDTYEPHVKEWRDYFQGSALKLVLKKKNNAIIEDMLDQEDIRFLQALEGFSDEAGVEFWGDGTHTLKEYKKARVPDKINELTKL